MKPSSQGKSGKSLLLMSRVFSFVNFMISLESFLILLSAKIKTVRFGQWSNEQNSVRRL